mgnify:CR=1 FL=1
MNTERTIVLENITDHTIGLLDTQNRKYILSKGAKTRISLVSLQDILDYPASRIFFDEDKVRVSNVKQEDLLNMGLSEEETVKYSLDDYAVVITEDLEEDEEIIVAEEPVKVVEVAAPKKPVTTKKPVAKKTSNKKK